MRTGVRALVSGRSAMTQGSGSVVLRGGTVLTVDATHRVLPGTDVLVTGDRIAEIGPDCRCPRAPGRSTPRAASSCRA
jgi:hypothetical protein